MLTKILYANNLWLQGGSLQPNNGVCLSYLFIKLINDILDMASFEGDKFTFPVTIVSKEMMNTWVFDEGKPSLKAIDRWRSAYANIVISEIVRIIITYVRQTEKQKVAAQMSIGLFKKFLWMNLWSPILCYLRQKFVSFLFLKKLYQRFFILQYGFATE